MPAPDIVADLPQACRDWLENRTIEEAECIIADMAGIARGKAMPWRKFARGGRSFLPVSIFYQTITGDYADLEGMDDQWTERDMLLVPDMSTATAAPWSNDVTVQIIHEMTDLEGAPIPVAPRNVLRRVMAMYEQAGWQPVVAPELEFYLTKINTDPNETIQPPVGRTGRQGVGRQAYSMSAVDEYDTVIEAIYDYAEAQGFEIETIIQEGGAGQLEINVGHGNPLRLADQVFFFKRSIREAALKNGCFATFMAKPMQDEPGSAMHIHQSVLDTKTGRTIFADADGVPTDLFYGFLAGQQDNLPSLISLLAPYVNSYRRYTTEDAAPINLEWGRDNRSTGLRIPRSSPEALRVENRIAGMDCNCYLAFAASLAAGYIGMQARSKPRPEVMGEAYQLPRAIPRSLHEALDLLKNNKDVVDVLGEEFCTVYLAIKRQEVEEFLQVISPWEREHLLLNV